MHSILRKEISKMKNGNTSLLSIYIGWGGGESVVRGPFSVLLHTYYFFFSISLPRMVATHYGMSVVSNR